MGDYIAGEEYDLDDETSDRFVILGYAAGDLSRHYTNEELDAIDSNHQIVGV